MLRMSCISDARFTTGRYVPSPSSLGSGRREAWRKYDSDQLWGFPLPVAAVYAAYCLAAPLTPFRAPFLAPFSSWPFVCAGDMSSASACFAGEAAARRACEAAHPYIHGDAGAGRGQRPETQTALLACVSHRLARLGHCASHEPPVHPISAVSAVSAAADGRSVPARRSSPAS